MILLDTDCLNLLEWSDNAEAQRLHDRLEQHPVAEIGTTIVTFEEIARGWLSHLSGVKKMADLIDGYEKLRRQIKLFCGMPIVDFDERAAVEFQRLRKEHRRLGTMDLRIASIALSRGDRLISRNVRDFQSIDGLRIEDWTK